MIVWTADEQHAARHGYRVAPTTHVEAQQAQRVVGADVVPLAAAGGGAHEGVYVQVGFEAHRLLLLPQLLDLACTSRASTSPPIACLIQASKDARTPPILYPHTVLMGLWDKSPEACHVTKACVCEWMGVQTIQSYGSIKIRGAALLQPAKGVCVCVCVWGGGGGRCHCARRPGTWPQNRASPVPSAHGNPQLITCFCIASFSLHSRGCAGMTCYHCCLVLVLSG